jgi:hypothetical protein
VRLEYVQKGEGRDAPVLGELVAKSLKGRILRYFDRKLAACLRKRRVARYKRSIKGIGKRGSVEVK